MASIEILFLSKEDVDRVDLGLQEVMDAYAISDIVVGHLVYEKAMAQGVGTRLPYYENPRDE